MGKESSLKPYQRGQDAGQEVPMRTPKRLYAEERIIYHPELLTCLHCGDLLVMWNYLAWDKTVQTLDRLLSIATRPGRCSHATCPGSRALAGCVSTSARPIARCTAISPPGSPSPKPMCAISISTCIYPYWPATSVSSVGDWPRSPRSKAA